MSASRVASIPLFLAGAWPYLSAVNEREVMWIVAGLVIPIVLIWGFLWWISRDLKGNSPSELFDWKMFWLLLSGCVHCYLEFHFVVWRSNSSFVNGMDLYGAADSRYGRPLESGTAAMELITACISGPLCFLLAFAIASRQPWRHPIQIILSTCQIYGLVWFIIQPIFYDQKVASDDPFLFWVIFVGLNAPWAIFPPILLIQSVTAVTRLTRGHSNSMDADGSQLNGNSKKKQ